MESWSLYIGVQIRPFNPKQKLRQQWVESVLGGTVLGRFRPCVRFWSHFDADCVESETDYTGHGVDQLRAVHQM